MDEMAGGKTLHDKLENQRFVSVLYLQVSSRHFLILFYGNH